MNKTPDQQVDELVAGLKMILLPQAPNAIQRQATEKELDSFGERAKALNAIHEYNFMKALYHVMKSQEL